MAAAAPVPSGAADPACPAPVEVGGGPLAVSDLVAVACRGAPVRLAPAVAGRLAAARAVVDAQLASGAAVYGLSTGLGAAVDTPLAPAEIGAFQARAILARSVGVGSPLEREEVRAALFARLAGLARGASGISPGFLDAIRDMLNRGVHPRVRRVGSLGEADLAPMAGLFAPFAGEGEAELGGAVLPGPAALERAGIVSPPFAPKDAIALLNSNGWSVGAAALACREVALAASALFAAGALSLEGFRANPAPLDPRLIRLRPARGQAEAAGRLRALLAGSDLLHPAASPRVQDPLSFRCLSPVLGMLLVRLAEAEEAVATELNGAGDSPAVLPEDGLVLSGVNFDTTALASALEALGAAAAGAASLSAFRITKLMSPGASGLPRFLAVSGGSRSGFAPAQKTAAALEAEIRRLALPVGPLALPVADGVEDYAPMTPAIADKTRALASHLGRLAALELVVAAAAIDLRPGIRLGGGTGRVQAFVRRHVPPFDEDRAIGGEVEALAVAIAGGALERVAEAGGGR